MLLPMSPVDSMFLIAESRDHPMHVGSLEIFQPPEGVDALEIFAMLDRAVTEGDGLLPPQLTKRARRSLTSLGQWGWETVDVDLGHHVRHDALPAPGGEAELMALCSRLHGSLLDRNRPLWEMHLIEGLSDGRFAIYAKIHHAVTDGVNSMKMIRRALSDDAEERNMPPMWEQRDRRSGSAPSKDTGAPTTSDSALRAARDAVGEVAGLVPALAGTVTRALRNQGGPLTLSAPKTPFNVPITGARQFASQIWSLERLRLVAKLSDSTINDVVLAMSSGALRSYLQDRGALPTDPLIAMVPVALASQGEESGGNNVGVLMCNLGTHLAEPADRLATIRTSMREGKEAYDAKTTTQILAMSALGTAGLAANIVLGQTPWLRPPFNLIISNVPGPSSQLYWNGARLEALHSLSAPVNGQGLNITCTSNDDEISFGVIGCRDAVPDLKSIPSRLGHELHALERTLGI
ncbi:diacylglycerol O-acyltransferase [Rhodococcus sp. WMMA185]|uniref:WS/DGAT/MGAT family O-acyltransferase n=1 Tax=Rhodococcus sp. WMMA185 TaxID=679318 RepID=UPI000878F3DD|nr:wax ester/triacylglycerol synthase family O-acyltransferase [Rhodococcus sp. WMMA185]AOW91752.1 diacylglycerol O-acyltransferase [Rhodococcus sp. WMMA185]